MESDNNPGKRSPKRNLLFFAIGVVVGFVLCYCLIMAYFTTHKREIVFKPDQIEIASKDDDRSADAQHHNDKYPSTKAGVPDNDADRMAFEEATEESDTLSVPEDVAESLEESEFETDIDEEVTIWQEQLIANKKVKVQISEKDTSRNRSIQEYIEVEQWSSPIKNKHSYHLKNNILKITGMDISKINVMYENGNYYLVNGETLYLLKHNSDFEKMNEVKVDGDNEQK